MANDNPIQLISEVLVRHEPLNGGESCDCDWWWDRAEGRNHPEHVAAEIDKALGGLTLEWLAVAFDARGHGYQVHRTAKNVDQLSSRWVSGWSEVKP